MVTSNDVPDVMPVNVAKKINSLARSNHIARSPSPRAKLVTRTSRIHPDVPRGVLAALTWARPKVRSLLRRFLDYLEVVSGEYGCFFVGRKTAGLSRNGA